MEKIISQTRLIKRTLEESDGRFILCYYPTDFRVEFAKSVMRTNYPEEIDNIWVYRKGFVMLTFNNLDDLCEDDLRNAKLAGF